MSAPGGCLVWGGSAPGGLLRGEVSAGGGGGGIPACTEADPPVNRMTERCKNITFATSLRTVTPDPNSPRSKFSAEVTTCEASEEL